MAITTVSRAPSVSRNTVELLIDLVEIKLGCVEIYDREDARELRALERAKNELAALLSRKSPTVSMPAGHRVEAAFA